MSKAQTGPGRLHTLYADLLKLYPEFTEAARASGRASEYPPVVYVKERVAGKRPMVTIVVSGQDAVAKAAQGRTTKETAIPCRIHRFDDTASAYAYACGGPLPDED